MMCMKAAGASPVIMIDIHQKRLKSLQMGADVVLNAKEVDVIDEVVKLTEAGPDTVLGCLRDGKVLNQSVPWSGEAARSLWPVRYRRIEVEIPAIGS